MEEEASDLSWLEPNWLVFLWQGGVSMMGAEGGVRSSFSEILADEIIGIGIGDCCLLGLGLGERERTTEARRGSTISTDGLRCSDADGTSSLGRPLGAVNGVVGADEDDWAPYLDGERCLAALRGRGEDESRVAEWSLGGVGFLVGSEGAGPALLATAGEALLGVADLGREDDLEALLGGRPRLSLLADRDLAFAGDSCTCRLLVTLPPLFIVN